MLPCPGIREFAHLRSRRAGTESPGSDVEDFGLSDARSTILRLACAGADAYTTKRQSGIIEPTREVAENVQSREQDYIRLPTVGASRSTSAKMNFRCSRIASV